MRNKCFAIAGLLTLFMFTKAFATDEILCPEEIVCDSTHAQSCRYNHASPTYWMPVTNGGSANVFVGKYYFTGSRAPYHSSNMDSAYTVCQYRMDISDDTYTAISLYAKQEANLEVYYHDDTLWEITSLEKSDSHGICSGKVALCPFKEQTALLIKNSTDAVLYTYNPTKVMNPGASAKILYDDMGFCMNMEPCKIRIFYDSGMASSITVNVQNKLKIESLSSENSFLYAIDQMENFNSAEITNTYNGSFPDARVYFSNLLNSSVNVLSGGSPLPNTPIAAKDNGFVIYEDVYKKCKNESECTLDVQTYSGLSIGQVLVNMKDEMAILSIESTRPSEIILNQTGQYSVEITYPYLK